MYMCTHVEWDIAIVNSDIQMLLRDWVLRMHVRHLQIRKRDTDRWYGLRILVRVIWHALVWWRWLLDDVECKNNRTNAMLTHGIVGACCQQGWHGNTWLSWIGFAIANSLPSSFCIDLSDTWYALIGPLNFLNTSLKASICMYLS